MLPTEHDLLPATIETDRMSTLFTLGRILMAVAVVSFGLEHFFAGNFPVALWPFPGVFPGRIVLVLIMGTSLIMAGLSIGLLWKADIVAFGLGVLFLLLALYFHIPSLIKNSHNGNAWTVFGELLGFSGGLFYVAGFLSKVASTSSLRRFNLITVGYTLFAGSLVIFGILHFVYAQYIATLIPSWIPAPLFWAYFVGAAFAGTAISLLTNWQRALSTGLLGLMFLLWVLLLHAPRAIDKLYAEPEWTSLFVALTMSGIAFTIAGSSRQKQNKNRFL